MVGFYEVLFADTEQTGVSPYPCIDFMVSRQRSTTSCRRDTRRALPFGLKGRRTLTRFRWMHMFEFRDGLISPENVWLDYSALREQLFGLHA
jgi:hypothetical protein